MSFCGKPLTSRSKYSSEGLHTCFGLEGHAGACDEFPYLEHLASVAPRVRQKIVRDATMTTGASWKSEDAGPNRIRRWVMTKTDEELVELGIDMRRLKPQVVAKLREKAATYDACMNVARRLTALAYGMPGAPKPPREVEEYFRSVGELIEYDSTVCLVCREPIPFALFEEARRGKAEIETSHAHPRLHTPENVGFAHRTCNIAQGPRTLDEFYQWMRDVLSRVAGRR